MVAPQTLEFNMVRSKECFKCNTVKLLEDFYKNPKMLDGHVNKCKECNKNDVTANRNKNIERVRAYDKDRSKNKHRIALAKEVTKKWREEDPKRVAAHNAVARAIKSGKLTRGLCERCGAEKPYAHHEDYNKPLDIMWLCQPCHKQRHKEITCHN
jgi:hypothetical protein